MLARGARRVESARVAKPPLSRRIRQVASDHRSAPRRGYADAPEPRASDKTDVVIVGAGPSGLAAAIKLKQLAKKTDQQLRVIVVEKAAEIGAHTLSGAVIEPRALNELIPDWKAKGAPLKVEAKEDSFVWLLNDKNSIRLPTPPPMHNKGNYIASLGSIVRWLAQQAEELGVEIFPATAASEVLFNEDGSVKGIATNDVGIGKDGKKKETYQQGMELHSRLTLFAEGCRGHLTKGIQKKYNLRIGADPQSYGIGIKELWEVKSPLYKEGSITHTIGWPMDQRTYGGSWIYHLDNNLVSIGFVVALDYWNPYLNPYREFQRFKHHPAIQPLLEGGKVIQYGARAISEGGLQSLPKLFFPGGALIGDTAGFLNLPKIKGTHTAMKSGMLAAESAFEALKKETGPVLLEDYPRRFRNSWLYKELHGVRNIRPAFEWGLLPAIAYSAIDTYVFRGKAPWTMHLSHADHESLVPKSKAPKIEYPKPDGKVSFDLLTNVARTGTNHSEDQPVHLQIIDPAIPVRTNFAVYDGPESRYCPAGVYEFVNDEKGQPRLQINASNCIHCKTCDIKDPLQNINWVTPEGGGGPLYGTM